MRLALALVLGSLVALRKESVDRNVYAQGQVAEKAVALRKESVDRNQKGFAPHGGLYHVALRKESVDRNSFVTQTVLPGISRSPQGERG